MYDETIPPRSTLHSLFLLFKLFLYQKSRRTTVWSKHKTNSWKRHRSVQEDGMLGQRPSAQRREHSCSLTILKLRKRHKKPRSSLQIVGRTQTVLDEKESGELLERDRDALLMGEIEGSTKAFG
ncbi:hypothetical protein LTS17_010539 [Exophiala oligosperma]